MELGFPKFKKDDRIPGYRAKWQHLVTNGKVGVGTVMDLNIKVAVRMF